jgi:uncharacterized protein YndB with AHSA1/START domain
MSAEKVANGSASFSTDAQAVELLITRVFDAPRELVWKACSEADRLAQWWGPIGHAIHVAGFDFRPGGFFHYSMQAQDGGMMWGKFDYLEISSPERIAFTSGFSDEAGGLTRAPFLGNFPLKVMNNWTFSEENGKTTLTLRGIPHNATQIEVDTFKSIHSSMQQGFGATFDQLDAYLAQV